MIIHQYTWYLVRIDLAFSKCFYNNRACLFFIFYYYFFFFHFSCNKNGSIKIIPLSSSRVPAAGISFPALAKETAYGECVCTIPSISEKALYNSTCVAVSLDGFKFPSTVFPSKSTTTMSLGDSWSYSNPLGLITT